MAGQQSKPVVLAVDDTPENLDVVKTILAQDYLVKAAINGKIALKIAETQQPDLILLDIMMPEMDGYEVCQALKSNPATERIPVIFISALDDTSDKVKGLDLGAVDYISKPFEAAEVIARVNTHLTMHRLRQELGRRNRQLEAANERMQQDLDAAARVQQALLPTSLPESDRILIAWQYYPCDELAGDSLNVHRLGPRYISLYVVDVSGHGVPAALLSVSVTRSLEPSADPSCLVSGPDAAVASPAEVARRLNTLYPMESNGKLYFTMIYGVLDLETGRFRFISAGHPGPILVRPGSPPEQIVVPSLVIGAFQDVNYSDSEVQLEAGDRLYLFSDGLYEETNDKDQQFQVSRLMNALATRVGDPLEASLEFVRQDLVAWHGTDDFTDDFSILAFEMLGGAAGVKEN